MTHFTFVPSFGLFAPGPPFVCTLLRCCCQQWMYVIKRNHSYNTILKAFLIANAVCNKYKTMYTIVEKEM